MRPSLLVSFVLVLLSQPARAGYDFVACGQSQQLVLYGAIPAAEKMLDFAHAYMNKDVFAEPRPFALYFGDLGSLATVDGKVGAMSGEVALVAYDCTNAGLCQGIGNNVVPYAFANPNDQSVHLCAPYWALPAVDVNLVAPADQRMVLVHELSHLPPAPLTDDFTPGMYTGPQKIQQAAVIAAQSMYLYAEAYEYFVWNLPFWQPPPGYLGCSVATKRTGAAVSGAVVVSLLLWFVVVRRRTMRAMPVMLVVLALGVVAFVASRRSTADHAAPSPSVQTPAIPVKVPLACQVTAPASARLGTPLPVTVQWTNTGDQPIGIWPVGTPRSPNYRPFNLAHQDGRAVPAAWDGIGVHWPVPEEHHYFVIKPGERVAMEVDVAAQWRLRPGKITVTQNNLSDVWVGEFDRGRALHGATPAELDCNTVQVQVVP